MSENEQDREVVVDTGTLLTVTTGHFLTDEFGKFHHAVDVLMGQPLMTHQFASEQVERQMQAEAKRQHPWTADPLLMDDFPSMDGLSREDAEGACRAWVAQHTERHGNAHRLVSPPETRRVPFTEGLPARFGGAS